MSTYDYKIGKCRINRILTSKTEIKRTKKIPAADCEFSYDNGVRTWVAALFVDIVDSSDLFKNEKDEIVARIMRSFCSELIGILKTNENYRQIGIRGDCVYAIYSAPSADNLESILDDAIMINTFQKMFQKMLSENSFPEFKIGIGLGASEDLVIKAGKKGSGISDNIWIGSSVVNASKLSSEANRRQFRPIVMDATFYDRIKRKKVGDNKTYLQYAKRQWSIKLNEYVYGFNLVYKKFDEWIVRGMKDE